MKTLFLMIATVVLISLNAFAQNPKDLPAKVKTSFDQKFPNAQKTKWGKENAKEWEAEFTMNNKDYSANFNTEGIWLETEYAITANEIPVAVKTAIDKDYLGYTIKISEISETTAGKVYEFELIKGTSKKEIAYDGNGKAIVKEKEKD